jgi:SAM-dependent methyltransferase
MTPTPVLSFSERLCLTYLRMGMPKSRRSSHQYTQSGEALRPLQQYFPDIAEQVRDKCVIDFGCSVGNQSLAFAAAGAREVLGVEILEDRLERARTRLTPHTSGIVSFVKSLGAEHAARYDLAVSLNSFEHFSNPGLTLEEIYRALRPGGKLLISFGPTWWSAYGPHQQDFTFSPWPHLFFSEKTFMKARGLIMNDPAKKTYADRWLNQMSVAKYERVIEASRFEVAAEELRCTRNLNLLRHLPVIREIAVNGITCVLRRPA